MWKFGTKNEPVSIFLRGRKKLDYEQTLENHFRLFENYMLSLLI